MKLPIYTELSNFTTRKNGQKIKTELSIALIINHLSDPVETINSVYHFMTQSETRAEMLIVNLDKEGYKYDKLLSSFPALRILLPQEKISLSHAIHLVIEESLSRDILFINDQFKMKALDLEIMKMYLSENHYGAIIPQILDKNKEIIPNIVKGNIQSGFLRTLSLDIKGSAISSLFPKYFCFILNREVFIQRKIALHSYTRDRFVLLELGYRIWQEGFFIFQVGSFKSELIGNVEEDIDYDLKDSDYLLFNLINISDSKSKKGRFLLSLSKMIGLLFSFRFDILLKFIDAHRKGRKLRDKDYIPPVNDEMIFKTINKDIE